MTPTQECNDLTEPVVYVVGHDAGSRENLQALFSSVSLPVRCYASPREFLRDGAGDRPGCLVLDLRMPGMSGLEMQDRLAEQGCHVPIVFLTDHGNVSAAVKAMRAGAVHFMTKPVSDEALIEAVHDAIRRHKLDCLARLQRQQVQARFARLTEREHEVMEAVVEGLSSKEIARQLNISYRTVELHRSHIMKKMEAHSVAKLVKMRLAANSEEEGLPLRGL